MEFNQLVKNIEAMIFASDRPLPLEEIADLVNGKHEKQKDKDELNFEEEIGIEEVENAIQTIEEKYSESFYPFEIKYTGGGYCFLTKPEYHEVVSPVCQDKKIKRLSSAAMETLSIIAYKQPVTKAEIEYLRGVSAEYSVQKLLEKELIVIAGRKEDAIGKPLLYKTTENFIDYLGIESMDELPKLSELFDINSSAASQVDSDTGEAIPENLGPAPEDEKPEDIAESDKDGHGLDPMDSAEESIEQKQSIEEDRTELNTDNGISEENMNQRQEALRNLTDDNIKVED